MIMKMIKRRIKIKSRIVERASIDPNPTLHRTLSPLPNLTPTLNPSLLFGSTTLPQ